MNVLGSARESKREREREVEADNRDKTLSQRQSVGSTLYDLPYSTLWQVLSLAHKLTISLPLYSYSSRTINK